MADTLIKEIQSNDGLQRLCIYRNSDGLFFHREGYYRDYSNDEDVIEYGKTIGAWQDDRPSGFYASAENAERDARRSILWLAGQNSASLLPFALRSGRNPL